MRNTPLVPIVAAVLAILLGGCSSGSDATTDQTPAEVLAAAGTTLDDTSGVHISLTTDDLPDAGTLASADGIGTHAPAFDGTIGVKVAGNSFDVPVVAVDGKVYAKLPLTLSYADIDPGDYGAPDPADLLDPDTGFTSLLPATTDLAAGDSVRGGQDNKEVLTTYTGTVPDTAVKNVIPSADGDFAVTYTVSDDAELRTVELTGHFYGADEDPNTYTIGFDDYGTEKDITAP